MRTGNSAETANRKTVYLGLDVIRLGAAILVAGYHLTFWWWLPARADGLSIYYAPALKTPSHLFSSGWAGVQIFFVLSGFVIAFSAVGKSAKDFIIGRAARLYPAAWICASITFAVTYGHDKLNAYIRSVVLSPVGPWISGVYWTLSVEIVFYADVALVLAIGDSSKLYAFGLILGLYSSAFWCLHLINAITGRHMSPVSGYIENPRGYLLL